MDLLKIYNNLYNYFGPQHWWSASADFSFKLLASCKRNSAIDIAHSPEQSSILSRDSKKFEICIGAILTQNTAWKNVEKAIHNLIAAGMMSPQAVIACRAVKLGTLIRPAGYYRQKTKKLKIFSKVICEEYNGDLDALFSQKLVDTRQLLLSIWGIGPETADSIILYAGNKPSFVIDAYTKRLCGACGVHFKTYDEYKNFFELKLPRSTKIFNEYHALIVAWGKMYNKDKRVALKILNIKNF